MSWLPGCRERRQVVCCQACGAKDEGRLRCKSAIIELKIYAISLVRCHLELMTGQDGGAFRANKSARVKIAGNNTKQWCFPIMSETS